MKAYKILSIDCWGNAKEGFVWNNWFATGEYLPADLIDKPRAILAYLRSVGLLTNESKGKIHLDDDQLNVCVQSRDGRTLYAIEYATGTIEIDEDTGKEVAK
jgi:hypothetical protein